nr:class I SAM-dependent methyltransferase [Maritimibacter sp. DP1N21-5]
MTDVTAEGPPSPALAAFMALLPEGAQVLDFGCGHGIATAQMSWAGFRVTGLDASRGLLSVARRLAPDAAFLEASFDDLRATATYNGIWANFALVHAPRATLPAHIARLHTALKPNGVLHLSMILGSGEERDSLQRAYTYVTEAELTALLGDFDILASETDVKSGALGNHPVIRIRARRGP